MKLLIAKKVGGSWSKVAVLSAVVDGSRLTNLPKRSQGQLEAGLARQAARFFAAESAARTVFYGVAGGEYRVDRV